MPLAECANRHTYNKDKHGATCPICGAGAKGPDAGGKTSEEKEAMHKLPEGKYVCGWLVCDEGVNEGRHYELHFGKNFVGSGDTMDVQILGDDQVDRYRHAAIAFDGNANTATLLPGESSGLVYLEGRAVYKPEELETYARIEIGGSVFTYVQYCSENHRWDRG